jgi:hypothetical protein
MQCQGYDGPCDRTDAVRTRQNTSYAYEKEKIKLKYIITGQVEYPDNEMNYATLCPECQKAANEYWRQMWADYRSMTL